MPDRGFVNADLAAALDTLASEHATFAVEFDNDPYWYDNSDDNKNGTEFLVVGDNEEAEEGDDDGLA